MPSKAQNKKPPVAPRRKRAMHALYLAQPFLQFFALMAVLFVLGRCSPLAPSTDKSVMKTVSAGAVATHSEHGDNSASEADIQHELRDVSRWEEMPVISQSDFASRVGANALDADVGGDAAKVNKLLAMRTPQRNVRLLLVHLDADQRKALFGGSVRIDLAQRLSAKMNADARKALLGGIHKILPRTGDLSAKAYLVLSDDDMASPDAVTSIPVATKFQLAIFPSDDKAFLQVNRLEQNLDDQQKKLIESNISKTGAFVALVLE